MNEKIPPFSGGIFADNLRKDIKMDNLIFSLDSTLPIFAVMLLGIIGRRKGILNDEYVSRANKFNFYTAMPVMLFMSMYGKEIADGFSAPFITIIVVSLLIEFTLSFLTARFLIKDEYMRGAFAQGAYRGNTALIGIALIINMYGQSEAASAAVACVVPMYNVGAVIMLTLFPVRGEAKKKSIGSIIKGIVTNPLILGTLAGTIAAAVHLHMPIMLEKTFGYLSEMAMGTALICIGASMDFSAFGKRWKTSLFASALKLMIFPLMLMPFAIMAGFRNDALMAIYIALGSPAAVNSYIMARTMNHDSDLASGIIVMSSLLGALTMTLWVFVMRSMGLV